MQDHKGARRESRLFVKCQAPEMAQGQKRSTFCNLHKDTESGIKFGIVWTAYVLLGSWVFTVIENGPLTVVKDHGKWERLKGLMSEGVVVKEMLELREDLLKLCPHSVFKSEFKFLLSKASEEAIFMSNCTRHVIPNDSFTSWMSRVEMVCSERLTILTTEPDQPSWSMVDAFYYTMTLVTTIGFGHIYPKSPLGRMFCVLFGLVGVPLTCILMAKSSNVLSNKMLQLYETLKKRSRLNPKTLLYAVTWFFLTFGFIVFMFIPSCVFVQLENWTFEESIYFTFITLATIGFGDYIAGYNEPQRESDIYKVSIVVWIMLGLGYWVLLLNFLQKAIKSNVPKSLRKTFRAKKIAKQAEFLRQLVTKAIASQRSLLSGPKDRDRHPNSRTPLQQSAEERLHMMALVVEAMSGKYPDRETSHATTRIFSKSSRPPRKKEETRSVKESKLEKRKREKDRLQLMALMIETMNQNKNDASGTLPVTGFTPHPSFVKSNSRNSFKDCLLTGQGCEVEHIKFEVDLETTSEVITEPCVDESSIDPQGVLTASDHRVKFDDLMRATVAVRTETMPGFQDLVSKAGTGQPFVESISSQCRGRKDSKSVMEEVTLPLKDVISLVLFVASLENDQQLAEEDTPSETSQPSSGSPGDHKENIPLLKALIQGNERSRSLSADDRKNVQKLIFKTALEHYLDDTSEEGDPEDDYYRSSV